MTQAYLVKLKDDGDYVGLFIVPNRDALVWSVDEITDPYSCLCRPISRGAIFFKRGHDHEDEFNDESDMTPVIEIDTKHAGMNGVSEYIFGQFETGNWRSVVHEGRRTSNYLK